MHLDAGAVVQPEALDCATMPPTPVPFPNTVVELLSGLALTGYIATAWLYLGMAILAGGLLVASFLPARQADTTAT